MCLTLDIVQYCKLKKAVLVMCAVYGSSIGVMSRIDKLQSMSVNPFVDSLENCEEASISLVHLLSAGSK